MHNVSVHHRSRTFIYLFFKRNFFKRYVPIQFVGFDREFKWVGGRETERKWCRIKKTE